MVIKSTALTEATGYFFKSSFFEKNKRILNGKK